MTIESMHEGDRIKALIKELRAASNTPSVQPGEWVYGPVITAMFGISPHSLTELRRKHWPEGVYWKKNPIGRVVFDHQKINEWMKSNGR